MISFGNPVIPSYVLPFFPQSAITDTRMQDLELLDLNRRHYFAGKVFRRPDGTGFTEWVQAYLILFDHYRTSVLLALAGYADHFDVVVITKPRRLGKYLISRRVSHLIFSLRCNTDGASSRLSHSNFSPSPKQASPTRPFREVLDSTSEPRLGHQAIQLRHRHLSLRATRRSFIRLRFAKSVVMVGRSATTSIRLMRGRCTFPCSSPCLLSETDDLSMKVGRRS